MIPGVTHCPRCKSVHLYYGDIDFRDNVFCEQLTSCWACGLEWRATYRHVINIVCYKPRHKKWRRRYRWLLRRRWL